MDYKDNIIFQVNALNRSFTLKSNRLLSSTGLESGSFFILMGLYKGKNYSLTDYALDFQSDRTTVSRAFNILTKNGYASIVKNSHLDQNKIDKRCAFHIITPAGKKVAEKYFPLLDNLHEEILEDNKMLRIFQLLK